VDQDPDHFRVNTGVSVLKDGEEDVPGIFALEEELDEEAVDSAVRGAKGCPVDVINVKNLDTGKDLYWGFDY